MKFGIALITRVLVAACLLSAQACSSNSDGSRSSDVNGSGPGSGVNDSSAGTSNSGGLNLNLGGETSSTGTAPGSGGSPEICDGIDNDHDGIIDNIDANQDGVCDCLLIATLGVKGMSGQGDVFATWLSARSNNGATALADQTLTPELLAKYQVIVAQDVRMNHPYADGEVKALADWVNAGGGLMTMLGYSTDATEGMNVNRLLAPFTMDYSQQHILGSNRTSTPVTVWIPHPIDAGVMAVGINNGYPVEGTGTTIATGGGFDLGKAQSVGKGHVFVWADEWITYNSEWQNHPDYQVQLFWLNAIKWLTVAGQCQVPIPQNPLK